MASLKTSRIGEKTNFKKMAKKISPQVGLEPTTNRLTADRSTAELLRILSL